MATLLALLAATLPAFGDTQAPKVEVFFPPRGTLTDAKLLTVSGSVADESRVASVTVNGVAAQVDDLAGRWRAQVPIGVGDHELVIASADVLGNIDARAATTSVRNDGHYPSSWQHAVIAPDGRTAYACDLERGAIVEVDLSTGLRRVVADQSSSLGTKVPLVQSLALDAVHGRLLVVVLNTLYGLDLTSGVFTVLSGASVGGGPQFFGATHVRIEPNGTHAIVSSNAWGGTQHLLRVDLANGNRAVVSGIGVGSGPRFSWIKDVTLDDSGAVAYVSTAPPWRVLAVDLVTGARTLTSGAGVGVGPRIDFAFGLSFDPLRRMVVATTATRVLEIDPATGNRSIRLPAGCAALKTVHPFGWPAETRVDPTTGDLISFPDDVRRIKSPDAPGQVLSRATRGGLPYNHMPLGVDEHRNRLWYLDPSAPRPSMRWLDLRDGAVTLHTNLSAFGDYFQGRGVCDFSSDRAWIIAQSSLSVSHWACSVDLDQPVVAPIPGFQPPAWSVPFRVCVDPATRAPVVTIGSSLWRFTSAGAAEEVSGPNVGTGPLFSLLSELCSNQAAEVIYAGYYDAIIGVDPRSGDRWIVASDTVGAGPSLGVWGLDFDERRRRIVGVGGGPYLKDHRLFDVDPVTGRRTALSDDSTGVGPPIRYPSWVAVDDNAGVAYVRTFYSAILAIEIESGDRVVVAR